MKLSQAIRKYPLLFVKSLFLLLALVALPSCSYKMASHSNNLVVDVPFIQGDELGVLNKKIVYYLSQSGQFIYHPSSAKAFVHVDNLKVRKINVGYRYEVDESAELTNRVIPSESRLFVTAYVSLKNSIGEIIKGPFIAKAHHDYDFDFFANFGGVTPLSRGQVEEGTAAEELARSPLFDKFARTISLILNPLES